MNKKSYKAISLAVLAAVLYGISSPVSKILLVEIPAALMAALLYLGAGIGMLFINLIKALRKRERIEAGITKKELPFTIAMIILDIAAPILLMLGLRLTSAGTVSLLNNFEIAATSMIALLIFKEAIGRRIWIAIILITIASIILSIDNFNDFSFSIGAVFVIAATICWGFENNATRMLSMKDPMQIVIIKGFGSGLGALIIAISIKSLSSNYLYILIALMLGFVAYGLSIYFYILAQRTLGAARTSMFYAAAPFIGVILSFVMLKERVNISFFIALAIMLIGSYFAVTEKHDHVHKHIKSVHVHKHNHDDGHHNHMHDDKTISDHSHKHEHEDIKHNHHHTPDTHHKHTH